MKLSIDSGEAYPHLFINEPAVDGSDGPAWEVPDDLGSAVLAAKKALNEAERALLVWLRHSPARVEPAVDRVLRNHLFADQD